MWRLWDWMYNDTAVHAQMIRNISINAASPKCVASCDWSGTSWYFTISHFQNNLQPQETVKGMLINIYWPISKTWSWLSKILELPVMLYKGQSNCKQRIMVSSPISLEKIEAADEGWSKISWLKDTNELCLLGWSVILSKVAGGVQTTMSPYLCAKFTSSESHSAES